MIDMISLAYWFPILEKTGVPVPATIIIETDVDFWPILAGVETPSAVEFLQGLEAKATKHGYPLFLRTGHTSAKHSWKDSCYVISEDQLGQSVVELLEFSAVAIPCLPWNIWAIREFLELDVRFTAFWGDMPIANERRYFIENGTMICSHPYWPAEAFERILNKPDNWQELLDEMNAEATPELDELSIHVSKHFEGAWSLDWAKAKDGTWYAIDMALMRASYHWPECPNNPKRSLK